MILELAKQLLERPSISPNDAGCQTLIANFLKKLDFHIEFMNAGDVQNLWARRGTEGPLLVFVGHTDVVPPGPLDEWGSDPFTPTIRDGYLYARGAADMKTAIAVMMVACQNFIAKYPQHAGSIAFLITSAEEITTPHGAQIIVDALEARGEKIDWCIVGEPSSKKILGDQIRNGRRGSLTGKLKIHGKQGHVAYPDLADNAIHKSLLALHEFSQKIWDEGDAHFPPTTLQISNINAGTGVSNVIPGVIEILFNFRYSPALTLAQLKSQVEEILQRHDLIYEIAWENSAIPFITREGTLIAACRQIIKNVMGIETTLSTTGGTSDGRFVAATGAEVVELGFVNETIHQVDECIKIADIHQLLSIYEQLLINLFCQNKNRS